MRRDLRLVVAGVTGAVFLMLAGVMLWHGHDDALESPPLRAFSLDRRPQSGRYLFDYAVIIQKIFSLVEKGL